MTTEPATPADPAAPTTPTPDPTGQPPAQQQQQPGEQHVPSAPPAPGADPAHDAVVKENVFLRAGVDLDSPLGKLLFDGYQGDVTPDAVKTAAAEVGALKAVAPPAPEAPPSTEADDRRILQQGANVVPEGTKHPHTVALEEGQRLQGIGATEDAVLGEAFHTVVVAGADGDQRVYAQPTPGGDD